MKAGEIIMETNITINAPSKVKTIASWAFPCLSISCPGNIAKKVSSSGTPR